MKEPFKIKDGQEAAHALDGEWLQPTENPFGHGCCDCGLFHLVKYRIVDDNGDTVSGKGIHIQLQFTRDNDETLRLRQFQQEIGYSHGGESLR